MCVLHAAALSIHHGAVSDVSPLLEVLAALALIVTAAQTRHAPSPSYLHTPSHTNNSHDVERKDDDNDVCVCMSLEVSVCVHACMIRHRGL